MNSRTKPNTHEASESIWIKANIYTKLPTQQPIETLATKYYQQIDSIGVEPIDPMNHHEPDNDYFIKIINDISMTVLPSPPVAPYYRNFPVIPQNRRGRQSTR